MSIQVNAPATFIFNFRNLTEAGADIGPLNLALAEHLPIVVKLKKPDAALLTIEQPDITITDAAGGAVEWQAPADTINVSGRWRAQAFAGAWPSRIVAFIVHKNL